MSTAPVEVGQWRQGHGTVWAVIEPHPRRRGFWIAVASEFSYDVEICGRRELEAMPLVGRDYFGHGNPHPGERYVLRQALCAEPQLQDGGDQC